MNTTAKPAPAAAPASNPKRLVRNQALKVLVLGASGHIGGHLLAALAPSDDVEATGASRHRPATLASAPDPRWQPLDGCDLPQLRAALQGMDVVVNCVAGNARAIAQGAQVLVQAALEAGRPRIIHLSSMAVYGAAEGTIREDAPLDPGLGWYGRAKCAAEAHLRDYAAQGGPALVLRPGCVHGPGSELWVGRIARWLRAGRLGDLGAAGDGWSNLVHVDDVVAALRAALHHPLHHSLHHPLVPGALPVYNLAAPDSPRWNDYFVDLALALGVVPVRRLGRQVQLDAWLAGPPLKIAQSLWQRLSPRPRQPCPWPEPLPPNLLRLWGQQIRLDATAATRELGLTYTPYAASLASSLQWLQQPSALAPQQPRAWSS